MNFLSRQLVFREIPDEISLSYLITGCPLKCPNCHSADSWNSSSGQRLSEWVLLEDIKKYRSAISCVLFMGGEWNEVELVNLLKLALSQSLKTALYTGANDVSVNIKSNLNYLKTGPYIESLGGLSSSKTNQKLINVHTNEIIKMHDESIDQKLIHLS